MARHGSRDAHADRGNFAFVDPEARIALSLLPDETQPRQQVYADRFQRADVFADTQAALLQVQDGIEDELARIVGCRATAAASEWRSSCTGPIVT